MPLPVGKHYHRICMVSDFFFPNMGGVEGHIYQLSQCLIALGHNVVVVTHAYEDRVGVRFLSQGLKVYYLPIKAVYNQCILPTVFLTMPLIRNILLRESITIVHGHSAFSALAHEAMFHARTMNIRAVFTDHSLFGFADVSSILTNEVLKFSLRGINHVICVSHTSKENTFLRARIDPQSISVIPNAVDATRFTPDPTKRCRNRIRIVVVSRLVYRKGADILAAVIPQICKANPDVDFLIAGNGPKRLSLEEMAERHQLQERVQMLGSIDHEKVRDVLVQSDIFLNCSLTEAFCIAIVEAACCGLLVVSTKVGGIPEVLPPHLITLAEPKYRLVQAAVEQAVQKARHRQDDEFYQFHSDTKRLYNWHNIALRTEIVYNKAMEKPNTTLDERLKSYRKGALEAYNKAIERPNTTLDERLKGYRKGGLEAGFLFIFIAVINYLFLQFLSWFRPAELIDRCPTFWPTNGNQPPLKKHPI